MSAVGFSSEVVAAAAVGVAAGAGGVATCNSAAGISSSQQAGLLRNERKQAVQQEQQTRNDDMNTEVQRPQRTKKMLPFPCQLVSDIILVFSSVEIPALKLRILLLTE